MLFQGDTYKNAEIKIRNVFTNFSAPPAAPTGTKVLPVQKHHHHPATHPATQPHSPDGHGRQGLPL